MEHESRGDRKWMLTHHLSNLITKRVKLSSTSTPYIILLLPAPLMSLYCILFYDEFFDIEILRILSNVILYEKAKIEEVKGRITSTSYQVVSSFFYN